VVALPLCMQQTNGILLCLADLQVDRMELSDEDSKHSSVAIEDEDEEEHDEHEEEEEEECFDCDDLSPQPSEPRLDPIPQDEEHPNVAVSQRLKEKLAQMFLARQQLLERQGDTALIDEHIAEMKIFLADSAKEMEAMDLDNAKQRTLAQREVDGTPLRITTGGGEDNAAEDEKEEPQLKRGRL